MNYYFISHGWTRKYALKRSRRCPLPWKKRVKISCCKDRIWEGMPQQTQLQFEFPLTPYTMHERFMNALELGFPLPLSYVSSLSSPILLQVKEKKKKLNIPNMTASFWGDKRHLFFRCSEMPILTWHLMPARLQVHVSGSQNTRQSQPQSSRDRRMARSSCFSSTSIFFTPEARSRALRFFVGRGCRKKYSSTSVLSKSISSSEMSSTVRVLASSDSTVPFFVIWRQKEVNKDVIWAEAKVPTSAWVTTSWAVVRRVCNHGSRRKGNSDAKTVGFFKCNSSPPYVSDCSYSLRGQSVNRSEVTKQRCLNAVFTLSPWWHLWCQRKCALDQRWQPLSGSHDYLTQQTSCPWNKMSVFQAPKCTFRTQGWCAAWVTNTGYYPEHSRKRHLIDIMSQVSMLSVKQGHRLVLARTHQSATETINRILTGGHANLRPKVCNPRNSSCGHSLLGYSWWLWLFIFLFNINLIHQ